MVFIQRVREKILCVTVMIISLYPRQSNHNLLCLLMSGIHSQRAALFYGFKFYTQVCCESQQRKMEKQPPLCGCFNNKIDGTELKHKGENEKILISNCKPMVLLQDSPHHHCIHKQISFKLLKSLL